jgi:hypothetical protein
MNLEEIFTFLKELLEKDADLAPIPFLGQIATAAAAAPELKEYNRNLEAALQTGGLAIVALVAEGDDRNPVTPVLNLENTVVLSIIENPEKNATGLTAFQYVRRILLVLKRGQLALHGARHDVSLGKPAYNVGPLNKGTTVYFINLLVRTVEPLGALNPAP